MGTILGSQLTLRSYPSLHSSPSGLVVLANERKRFNCLPKIEELVNNHSIWCYIHVAIFGES